MIYRSQFFILYKEMSNFVWVQTHPSMTSKHSLSHGGQGSKDPSTWRVQEPSLLQERRSRTRSKTSSEGRTKKWKDFSFKYLYPTIPQIWLPWTFASKYSLSPSCLDWLELNFSHLQIKAYWLQCSQLRAPPSDLLFLNSSFEIGVKATSISSTVSV